MNTLQQTLECLVCSNIWPSVMRKVKDAQGNEYYLSSTNCCDACGLDESVVIDSGEEVVPELEVAHAEQHA